MKTSKKGLNFIKKHEGCILHSYLCDAGILTIGIGHTGNDIKEGMEISEEKAFEFLKKDVKKFENIVNQYFKNKKLHQCQFDALVSLAFNCGAASITKSNLCRRILNGDDLESISKEWIEWCHINKKTSRKLLRRRSRELSMFLSY